MKKNLILSALSALAKIIGSIVLVSVLARVFSLADFGDFTYTLTLGTLFSLFVDYGYNIKLIKDVSLNEEGISRIAGKAFFSKLFLLSITCLVFFLINKVLKNQETILFTSFFLFLSLVFFSFTNVVLSVFKGQKKYDSELKIVVFDNISTFLIVSIAAYMTKDILFTAIFFAIAKFIGFVASIISYKKFNTIQLPSKNEIKQDLFQALPYAVHYWVGSFYLNIDTVIMENMVTSEEIGIYQSGIRIVLGFGIILTVINAIYLPLLSTALVSNKAEFKKNSIDLNNNVLRMALLATIGLIIFARPIILILFGSKFMPLLPFFWVFAFIIGLRIIGSSYGILLTVSDKQRIRAIAGAISILLIIVLDSILIPRFGYIVASYVLLTAHLFINTFYILSVYHEYKSFFLPSFKQFFDLKNML